MSLRNRGEESIKSEVHSDDTSLQIHSCHGPWREIEVLYDRLLYLFETDRNLTPKDVLVMTPDIETYAPYITAVFDACQDEKKRIPYSIADRRAPSQSIVIDLFLKIIGLCKGRLRASEIIDILGCAAVRSRLGLSAQEMDRIHRWIFETGIRWGIDGEHRASFGLPPFEENSWKAGIERLILGYSMMGDEEELFLGKLPHAIVGDEADTLGAFLAFLEQLFDMVRTLDQPRTLAEWSDTLVSLRSLFIMEDEETVGDVQLLDDELKGLKRLQEFSGFDEPVEIEVVRYFLSTQLGQVQLSRGFLAGGVTFCEMLPMRSIPFRMIGLIGMNSDAYPREERAVAFDLIAQDPQPGDRSLRDEDRYLFLEALLSARDYLYISYVGQSIRDNSVIPPSVLVSELLDYCEQGFSAAASSMGQLLLTNHRLQPFNTSYFTREGRFFSYSQEDFDTAVARSKPLRQAVRFISKPLDEPPAEWKQLSIANLKRFYQNPARYLLKYRLGINLEEPDRILQGEEPFSLDSLDGYLLGDLLIRKNLEGKELKQYIGLARARGILPPGIPGELAYSSLKAKAEAFSELVRSHVALPMLAPIEADFDLAGFRVSGRIDAIPSSGTVTFHFAKDKGRYQIAAWIDHLILNLVSEPEYPRATHLITTDRSWRFERVEEAAPLIETLLHLYWRGVSEPLRFFPESSLSYAERLRKGEQISDARKSAQSTWQGSDFVPGASGEGDDPYLNLCFSDTSPFSDPFAEITLAVLEPLLEHREKVR